MRMFRLLSCILILVMQVIQPVEALAKEQEVTIQYLDNGDYIETVITVEPQLYGTPTYKSGNKTSTYKNADGEVLWSITVYARFIYITDEQVSECIEVSGQASAYDSNWTVTEAIATKNGATASATTIATKYMTSAVVKNIEKTVTLSCDIYGNLS